MTPATLLLGLQVTGVVDRVEGDTAVIEWALDELAPAPATLARRLAEGRRVRLRLRPARGGCLATGPHALLTPHGPLALPATVRLEPGRTYRLRLRTGALRPPGRPRPTDLPDAIDLSWDDLAEGATTPTQP